MNINDIIMKPNLFIIGAPKSGTTALSEYLRMHPQVFFSDPKEPQFFSSDYKNKGAIRGLEEYHRLFASAGENCKIVGEGSTKYLSSKDAVERIEAFNPQARYIVMLRNPIEMAVSLHEQVLFNGDENEQTFEQAWRLQEERKKGKCIPPCCDEPRDLQYGEMCMIGRQLERVLSIVNPERLKIIFFEDFVRDVPGTYADVLSYLRLKPWNPVRFERINQGKRIKYAVLKNMTRLMGKLSRACGNTWRTGLIRRLNEINSVPAMRRPLSGTLKKELHDYFANDIKLLERITNRELGHWLEP